MGVIFDKLSQFGFHDAVINSVVVDNDGLEILFKDGLYHLDINGKETTKTQNIKLILRICDFNKKILFEHISIRYQKKHRVIELPLEQTTELNNLYDLIIDNVYFSSFDNSVLIKCSGTQYVNAEIVIENIVDVTFVD